MNQPVKPPHNDIAGPSARHRTMQVMVGNVAVGGGAPIVVQSMTNTDTADVAGTIEQVAALSRAGSELVRITVDREEAAAAVPHIRDGLRKRGITTPLIGDFHYIGHKLLAEYPACAEALDKYRINPGNVGFKNKRDTQFADIIEIANKNDKPVRIGANWGSLDQELLTKLMEENAASANPRDARAVTREAMVQSALLSAVRAEELGMPKNRIILSAKVSAVQDLIAVYKELVSRSDYAIHLGLTEAGMGSKGIVASSAALGILLQDGIGDTIRISLTPEPGGDRTLEVQVAQELLQTMGFRTFVPLVAACPGCGRTTSTTFQELARSIQDFIRDEMPGWKTQYPGVEELNVAVMGCIVNGPGESKHANIGISLPGTGEAPAAPVFVDGKKFRTLRGPSIATDFKALVIDYIDQRYGGSGKAPADTRDARRSRRELYPFVVLAKARTHNHRVVWLCRAVAQAFDNPIHLWLWVPTQGRDDKREIRLHCTSARARYDGAIKTSRRNVMSSLSGKQGPRYRHIAGDSEPYETIAVEKLTPIIGAEISGVDIAKLVSDDARSNRQIDEVHRALAENLVIFFRDQHITPAQHLAFGRKFGELHIHPAAPHEGDDPALMKIYADKDSPRANGEGWHTDVSCDIEPPMGSILYIRQSPPRGGDTLFANMYAAYDALSDRMKTYLDGLTALHDGESTYRGLYANYGVADRPAYPRAEHPIVRTHPVTGKKALYVNRGFTRHIVGIPRDESDAMLAYLYQHMENPLFQCRFRWSENAIAFWDNRCTQHRAMWDYWPHTRAGTRVTVKGERPV